MLTVSEIAPLRQQILQWRRDGKRIAFVPTMGNLHQGHMALITTAKLHADVVVASVFVNPMQFDRADDLAAYPRTLEADSQLLDGHGAHLLFAPTPELIFPQGLDDQTFVEVPGLSQMLEGACRPGHFRGVSTIVSKLFNIVQPDVACFGEKDYQQLALIRQMVRDLAFPIEIVAVPTVRDVDGLALSSRNGRLNADERQRAPVLARTMRWIGSQLRGGRRDVEQLLLDAGDQLRAAGLAPDELFICDANTLQPMVDESPRVVVLMAAFLGQTRLIDNLTVDLVG
ncbi:Pantothenate synthetase [Vibrio stylophorae]|uniref:Pantothenate synthetase n=1 Tax=Vibrio stylophorae TaxID=659351 RepID=A0ABM8ZQQ4_9VIBR|nr:pantoate--beta-alanine ligase [Vibrio stylophorae]CAH0532638.1 Pantothenate synthetase [Vibrio stylophorae]